jgi:NADPH:quinone reductase-like Zn-dependent oxidoreductase
VLSAVLSATDGRGADVVLYAVGGPMFGTALKLLAHRGRLLEITGQKSAWSALISSFFIIMNLNSWAWTR